MSAPRGDGSPVWSPDGQPIAFTRAAGSGGSQAVVTRPIMALAMRRSLLLRFALAVLPIAIVQAQGPPPLDIYVIDVEGGQATFFRSPSGESMLVDTGWAGFDGRDADRIASVAKQAGVQQIDYLVITHYHGDHVGGVPQLAARLPIRAFVDHGPTVESGDGPAALFQAYVAVRDKGRHIQVKPGDKVPIAGLDVLVVSSGGALITSAVAGAGASNPLCRDFTAKEEDTTENARSVGMMIRHGNFKMLDIGDLTWNKERDLVCPNNLLGSVDLYLTTHHGTNASGPAVLVHAVHPRVAVMNNGSKKGGSPEAWRAVRSSPGLADFWQVHYSEPGGAEHNAPAQFIANLDESAAHFIKISARPDGSFAVTNTRNGLSKEYPARRTGSAP